jgi:hypothetical protein
MGKRCIQLWLIRRYPVLGIIVAARMARVQIGVIQSGLGSASSLLPGSKLMGRRE